MRIKKSIAIFFLLTALLLFAAGCTLSQAPAVGGSSSRPGTGGEAEGAADKLSVVCTIFPQYDFVRQIAGDRVELTMLIRPGGDVHYYEPTPQDIIDIYDCDLFIYVGGESDSWADRILESAAGDDLEVLSMMEYSGRIPEETEEGMTVIMVSHDVKGALEYADHILHLRHDGYFFGTLEEYRSSPYGSMLHMEGGAR